MSSPVPRFHLAVPVDDLDAARHFYGTVLGLPQGRSADTWVELEFKAIADDSQVFATAGSR